MAGLFLKRKKNFRPGSLDWEVHFQGLPAGPASIEELLSWPETALNVLRDKCPACVAVLERNLLAGCSVITHYSGKGTAESAMADIGEYLEQVLEPLQAAKGPSFSFASACDISDMCRRVLCGHGSASAAKHVFGDICDRIPTQEPELSDRSHEEVRSFLEEHGESLYTTATAAFCYRHNATCCVVGRIGEALTT